MEYRTYTASFKSILRKDVNPQISEAFLRKVNAALYNVSDHLMDIQLVVFTLMLFMKSSQFVVAQSGDVEYNNCQGFSIESILPSDFRMKSDTNFSAPPLPSDAVKSESFCKTLKQLFQSQHIDYLHVTLFGKKGSKSTNPIFHALTENNHPLILSFYQETSLPANKLMQAQETSVGTAAVLHQRTKLYDIY